MRTAATVGPLRAVLRECWVRADNLKLSAELPAWTNRPLLHAIVVESITVDTERCREGHCRRFIESLCSDKGFELVVVEGVGNPHLAEALLRWGWDCDQGVMDFYWRHLGGEKTDGKST